MLGIAIEFSWAKYSKYGFEDEQPPGAGLLAGARLGPTLVGVGPPLWTKPLEAFPDLYLKLAEAKSDAEGHRSFAQKYGLLSNPEKEKLRYWGSAVSFMKSLVARTQSRDSWPIHNGIYEPYEAKRRIFSIRFAPDPGRTRLRAWMEPDSLFNALILQCLFHATAGGTVQPCKACGSLFEIGGTRGLRSHAVFCSKECRFEYNHRNQGAPP